MIDPHAWTLGDTRASGLTRGAASLLLWCLLFSKIVLGVDRFASANLANLIAVGSVEIVQITESKEGWRAMARLKISRMLWSDTPVDGSVLFSLKRSCCARETITRFRKVSSEQGLWFLEQLRSREWNAVQLFCGDPGWKPVSEQKVFEDYVRRVKRK